MLLVFLFFLLVLIFPGVTALLVFSFGCRCYLLFTLCISSPLPRLLVVSGLPLLFLVFLFFLDFQLQFIVFFVHFFFLLLPWFLTFFDCRGGVRHLRPRRSQVKKFYFSCHVSVFCLSMWCFSLLQTCVTAIFKVLVYGFYNLMEHCNF